jgi:23S rRNA (cytidine1920-2'-O)/16S rRNA (cytidine1409-2'-O)-methyltransferase
VLLENTNARNIRPEDIGDKGDIITIDVSFISLKKIIPPAVALLAPGGRLVTLVKPQFEVGRYHVGKGGIVRDDERIRMVLDDIREFGKGLGLRALDQVEAPRERDRKNREYFVLWDR